MRNSKGVVAQQQIVRLSLSSALASQRAGGVDNRQDKSRSGFHILGVLATRACSRILRGDASKERVLVWRVSGQGHRMPFSTKVLERCNHQIREDDHPCGSLRFWMLFGHYYCSVVSRTQRLMNVNIKEPPLFVAANLQDVRRRQSSICRRVGILWEERKIRLQGCRRGRAKTTNLNAAAGRKAGKMWRLRLVGLAQRKAAGRAPVVPKESHSQIGQSDGSN